MTPTEPILPAASMISRIEVSNSALTAGSSARMNPRNPAQMADTLMARPRRFCSMSLKFESKYCPPGS